MVETIRINLGSVANSVNLASEDETFGIKDAVTGDVVVASGTAAVHEGNGVYSYTFSTAPGSAYIVVWEIQAASGGAYRFWRQEVGPFDDEAAQIRAVPEFRGTFSQGTYATLALRSMNLEGVAINVDDVNVVVRNVASGEEIVSDTPDKVATGFYVYEWAINGDQSTGGYDIFWTYSHNGQQRTEIQSVSVVGDPESGALANQRILALRIALEHMLFKMMAIPIRFEQAQPSSDLRTYHFAFPRWNQSARVNVYRNQNLITSGYEVDYLRGVIVFDQPNLEEDQVHVDYNFRFFDDEQLTLFLKNGVNMFNIFAPHTVYSITGVPDLYVPAVLHAAAVEALRTFMQALFWPDTRLLFEDRERADKVYQEAESLKKNYEETWKTLCDQKRLFPYVGLTRLVVNPIYPLPGGRARFFRSMFGAGM